MRKTLALGLTLLAMLGCSDVPPLEGNGPQLVNKTEGTAAGDKPSTLPLEKSAATEPPPAEPSSDTTTPPAPPATPAPPAPPAPPAATFPRAADGAECQLGDGLYCGKNGVEGAPQSLYRCAQGTISEEQACATSCLSFPPGINDACDGQVKKCPLGNGLYCGQNGVSGDLNTLYRCTNGSVAVEQACAATCVHEAPGINDRCE